MTAVAQTSTSAPVTLTPQAGVKPVYKNASVIDMQGVISSGDMSYESMRAAVYQAFGFVGSDRRGWKRALPVDVVVLRINSPGGDPVQSSSMQALVRQLSAETGIPVASYIETMGASGGYDLACGGDLIVAHPSAVVGSIGVVSEILNYEEALRKIGVKKTVVTTGDRKHDLNPSRPMDTESYKKGIEKIREIQGDIYADFVERVVNARGNRLSVPVEEWATGEVWTGKTAQQMGLVDAVAPSFDHFMAALARIQFEQENVRYKTKTYGRQKGGFLSSMFRSMATQVAEAVVSVFEKRVVRAQAVAQLTHKGI